MFHHLSQLPSRFCQILIGPGRIGQTVDHSKSKSQPIQFHEQMGHPVQLCTSIVAALKPQLLHHLICSACQVRSRYEEDVHPGNHTAIFGSYFNEGKWGFACCHQFVRNSYCTGAAGRAAGESMLTGMLTMPPPKQPVDDDERGEREKEVKVSKCTLWGVRSVVIFCFVFFWEFWGSIQLT